MGGMLLALLKIISAMTLSRARQPVQHYKYCFTVNNPDDVNLPLNFTDVRYLRWQYEAASTPHLQGFIWLSKKKRITQLTAEVPGHYEPAKGSPAQNYAYCGKCCDDYKIVGHVCLEQRLLGYAFCH